MIVPAGPVEVGASLLGRELGVPAVEGGETGPEVRVHRGDGGVPVGREVQAVAQHVARFHPRSCPYHHRLPRERQAGATVVADGTERGILIRVIQVDRVALHVDAHEDAVEDMALRTHEERFVGLWQQIAKRYKDRPPSLIFELLNEPCKELHPVRLNLLMARAIDEVRQYDKTRLLLVDSYFWANVMYLGDLDLPREDPNIAASFHVYQPTLFTHQGVSWAGPGHNTVGVVFPGPPKEPLTPSADASSIGWMKSWFDAYNTLPTEKKPCGPKTIDI